MSFAYGIPVKQLQQLLDADEFAELLVYDRIHGIPRPWLQTGVTAATQANCHSTKKTYSATDFMPVKVEQKDRSLDIFEALKKRAKKD